MTPRLAPVTAIAARIAGGIVALALPPRCPGCGVVTAADHQFCADCWRGLRFPGDPACVRCGLPFAFDRGAGACCAPCLADPPPHDGVRAAVVYGPVARDVALRLKYGGRLALAETMARLMARHLPADATLLVPVPLHRRRLWSRGYNQSVLIADALAKASGVPVARDALCRTKATPPLRNMGPRERARTVRGAFALVDPARIAGRSVVLIDDVHTSGATTDACVRRLREGGATRVVVLCWARVIATDD